MWSFSIRTAGLRLLRPKAQNIREGYLAKLAAHREALRRVCASRGWGISLSRTDGSTAETLLALRMRLSAPDLGVAYGAA